METLKERHGCVTFWLWTILVVSIVMFFYYIVAMFTTDGVVEIVGQGVSSIMHLGCILGTILMIRWNKLGFFLFLICQAVLALLSVFSLTFDLYEIAALIVLLVMLACLWRGVLQFRRNGVAAWENMSTGWDYQHCRHLYQVFLGLTFIIFLLILWAVVNKANSTDGNTAEYVTVDSIAIDSAVVDTTVVVEVIDPFPYDEENQELAHLKRFIKEIELPIDVGMGVVITNIYVDLENLVWVAECDEDIIDLELLKASKREAKQKIINSLKDKANKEMIYCIKLCIEARKGMEYRYVGDTSGKEYHIEIPFNELRKLRYEMMC